MTINPADVIAVAPRASIRISLIALVVGLALVALRIRGGAVCHAAWTAVVVTMLLLPVMPKWLPTIPIWMPERHAVRQWANGVETPAPPRIAGTPVARRRRPGPHRFPWRRRGAAPRRLSKRRPLRFRGHRPSSRCGPSSPLRCSCASASAGGARSHSSRPANRPAPIPRCSSPISSPHP